MNLLPRRSLALLGCAIFASAAAMAEPDRTPPGHMMHGPGPMFLRGIVLDQAQQDKLFAIVHAQAPLLREQDKAARQAHEALRAMATSGQFDEAKAAALAQAGARAMAATALQQARTDAQVFALLSPEQRRQAAEQQANRPPHPRQKMEN